MLPLRSNYVQCVITSPPYWGLRDYGLGERGLGLQQTPEAYISALADAFDEVHRVLREDGTCWVVLGDSYQNAKGQAHGVDPKQPARRHGLRPQDVATDGLKPKDLVGIPWLFAFEARRRGWYLRSDIIWAKAHEFCSGGVGSTMPESVRDRPTRAHETVFLLTKSPKYFYDAEAVRQDGVFPAGTRAAKGSGTREGNRRPAETAIYSGTRNLRDVWFISPKPFSGWGYDFGSADYVDARGIPRKWSPDCPTHERDGRQRLSGRASVSCGEREADPRLSNGRIDSGLAPTPLCDGDPTPCCNTPKETDILHASPQKHSGANSKPASPERGRSETAPHNEHIPPSSVVPTPDLPLLVDVDFASGHNSEMNRTDRAGRCAEGDAGGGEKLDHTPCSSLSGYVAGGNSRTSRTVEVGPDCASAERASRNVHSRSHKSCEHNTCTCTVSQTSHFATFPPDLVEPCLLAGSAHWQQDHKRSVVLDPFCGSGTVGLVAAQHGRPFIGIDLKYDYLLMAKDRLRGAAA